MFQLRVARTLFRCEIVQGDIRKKAREIVYACGKSINAILRLLRQIQQPSPDIVAILNTPTDEEDIVSVTDQLGKSLLDAIADAKDTLALLHEKTTF